MATDSSRTARPKSKKPSKRRPTYARVKDFLDGLTPTETLYATYELLKRLGKTQPTQAFSISHPDDPADFVGVVTPPAVIYEMSPPAEMALQPLVEVDDSDPRPTFEQVLAGLDAEFGRCE